MDAFALSCLSSTPTQSVYVHCMTQGKYLAAIKKVLYISDSTTRRSLTHVCFWLTPSQVPGFVKVDRLVCGECNDFKIIVKLQGDKFGVSD